VMSASRAAYAAAMESLKYEADKRLKQLATGREPVCGLEMQTLQELYSALAERQGFALTAGLCHCPKRPAAFTPVRTRRTLRQGSSFDQEAATEGM